MTLLRVGGPFSLLFFGLSYQRIVKVLQKFWIQGEEWIGIELSHQILMRQV
jgi:hypothetical protein